MNMNKNNDIYCIPMNDIYPNCDIKIPKIQTNKSAGYDLYANSDGCIKGMSHKLIKTKIRIKIPDNHCGQIWPRSSLSLKNGIETGAGIIDSDYQGEVGVILYNHTNIDFKFSNDMRIAQLLIIPIINKPINQCIDENNFLEKFSSNERGSNGFGSTGK